MGHSGYAHTHRHTNRPGKRRKLITHFKKTNPPVLLHLLNKRVGGS